MDGEKTKEKGSPSLATGGTWELIGNDITGLEMESAGRRSKAVAQTITGETMVEIQEASLVPRREFGHCVMNIIKEKPSARAGKTAGRMKKARSRDGVLESMPNLKGWLTSVLHHLVCPLALCS